LVHGANRGSGNSAETTFGAKSKTTAPGEFDMTAAARKAFDTVVHFLSVDVLGREAPSPKEGDDQHRVGKYYADYSLPTQEELNAPQPELDELYKNSKPISGKREL
jgi:hypothetical protein